jgi:hypothetical protein
MDLGRVEYYLDSWRDWMQTDNHRLGYKSKSTGFNSGGVHSFEDMADEIDNEAAKIVDQVINDLPIQEKTALHIFYLGISTNIDLDELERLLDSAIGILSIKLPKKNLY